MNIDSGRHDPFESGEVAAFNIKPTLLGVLTIAVTATSLSMPGTVEAQGPGGRFRAHGESRVGSVYPPDPYGPPYNADENWWTYPLGESGGTPDQWARVRQIGARVYQAEKEVADLRARRTSRYYTTVFRR